MLKAKLLIYGAGTSHFFKHLCKREIPLIFCLIRPWLHAVHLSSEIILLIRLFLLRYLFSQLVKRIIDAFEEVFTGQV